MKRIPGIKPQFERCSIQRPDGSILEGWEMFVGERSYGRSDSKEALLESWEARLAEAENARPFAFRPLRKRQPLQLREGTKQTDGDGDRPTQVPGAATPTPITKNKRAG